jgi:hypothetical protein
MFDHINLLSCAGRLVFYPECGQDYIYEMVRQPRLAVVLPTLVGN